MIKIYIPQEWEEEIGSGISSSWVTAHVATELGKLNTTYLKTDGCGKMTGNIDVDNNEVNNLRKLSGVSDITVSGNIDLSEHEIINTKFNQSSNALVPRYVIGNNYEAIEDVFDKGNTSIIPVTGQIVTDSSSAGNSYKPEFVFDGLTTTQWVISQTDQNPWIGVQFPNALKLYKIILHPRLGNQRTTHIITSCSLHGSNDGKKWTKIMESTEHINKIVTFDFLLEDHIVILD